MNSVVIATLVGNVALIASTVLAIAFVALYASTARWWETESGRNVMAFMAVVAVQLTLSVVRIFSLVRGEWFLWLRLGTFVFVPVVLAWRLWMLVRVQILDNRAEDAKGKGTDNV